MKPLLSSLPQKRRTILFAPVALGAFLVLFLVLALSTDNFLVTFLFAPPGAVGAAYALCGWPVITRKDGSPLVTPKMRKFAPLLVFPAAPLFAFVLYPVVGTLLTAVGFPVSFVAIASIVLSAAAGGGLAYLAFGFPDLVGAAQRLAAKFPPERRPFLFFPAFVVLFLAFYFVFGVVSTRLLGRASSPSALLNLQVLVLLPLTLVLAAGLAYLLFGFPKPKHNPLQAMEKVTGRQRPLAFAATFLLLGVPLTFTLGALVSSVGLLPDELLLPLGVLLGFSLSLGIAALVWGTPRQWRRFADYKPGLPKGTRIPLLVGGVLATVVVVTVIFGLAGADIFWGLLTGGALGLLLGLKLSGATKVIAERKGEATLVPELPDRVKPLVLFPSWFLTTGLLFMVFTYLVPDLIAFNFLLALAVGLFASVALIEQSLFQEMRERRRQEREKRKAWEARRRAALEGRDTADEAEAAG